MTAQSRARRNPVVRTLSDDHAYRHGVRAGVKRGRVLAQSAALDLLKSLTLEQLAEIVAAVQAIAEVTAEDQAPAGPRLTLVRSTDDAESAAAA